MHTTTRAKVKGRRLISHRCARLVGLAVALCLFCPRFASAQVFLVKDGKPSAEIVIAPKAPRTTALAAEELQKYIEKISGASLPIVNEAKGGGAARIYVGRSAFTDERGMSGKDLDYGAFRMESGLDWLILFGRDGDFTAPPTYIGTEAGRQRQFEEWDKLTGGTYGNPINVGRGYNAKLKVWDQADRGSINAVHEFLRMLGVRWYFPGKLGEVTPRTADITIPEVNRTVRPDFAMRNFFQYYKTFGHDRSGEEALWRMRLGLNSGRESFGLGGFGHGLRNVHARDKSDPEMFALYGGKRSVDSHWGAGAPCLSSEAFFQSTLKYVRAVFRIYPEQEIIDIAPVDGYGDLCQCDLCKDKGTPERGWNGRMSDYVLGFMNRVAVEIAKTDPDRKINCLAYSGYQQPPEKIETLSPNLTVIICRWRSDFIDPGTRTKFRELTEAWLEKLPSKELYIWDYYLHSRRAGTWEGVPVYFTHIIDDDLKFLKGKSSGEFMEVARNWPAWGVKWHALAANHLNLYVTARLYWDADLDVDALLEEYYTNFYGPARDEMRAFVEYAEANWNSATKDAKVIDRLVELLGAAGEKAGDTIYGERIALLTDYMEPLRQRRDQLAKGRTDAPKVRAYYRHQADITLDGKLDEPLWDGVAAYALSELETGRAPAFPTSFKVAWSPDSLYFGIVCKDADGASLNIGSDKDEDGNIFMGDNVELLVETQSHAYYQIVISPSGAVMDLDRKGEINSLWSSQVEVASHIGDNGWSLEVRLPVAGEAQEVLDANNGVSGRQPSETHPWYFNICRQRLRETGTELSAFSPTGNRSFHEPMKFGELFVR